MTTPDIHTLVGAYVLDAVDDTERTAFEAHLPACPACRAAVREFRATAALLGTARAREPGRRFARTCSTSWAGLRSCRPRLTAVGLAVAGRGAPELDQHPAGQLLGLAAVGDHVSDHGQDRTGQLVGQPLEGRSVPPGGEGDQPLRCEVRRHPRRPGAKACRLTGMWGRTAWTTSDRLREQSWYLRPQEPGTCFPRRRGKQTSAHTQSRSLRVNSIASTEAPPRQATRAPAAVVKRSSTRVDSESRSRAWHSRGTPSSRMRSRISAGSPSCSTDTTANSTG